jgi:accessory colonization factor AcfC
MLAEVKIIEGGQLIKTERMKLKTVKEFSDNIIIYENEDGRAVVYFKNKDEFVLISIDMA